MPAPASARRHGRNRAGWTPSGRSPGRRKQGEFADNAVAIAVITLIAVALALLTALGLIQRFLNWQRLGRLGGGLASSLDRGGRGTLP